MIRRSEASVESDPADGDLPLSKDEVVVLIVSWRGRQRNVMPASVLLEWPKDQLEGHWLQLSASGR
jgi:hypothetical protein